MSGLGPKLAECIAILDLECSDASPEEAAKSAAAAIAEDPSSYQSFVSEWENATKMRVWYRQ